MKKMRVMVMVLLAFVCVLGLSACGEQGSDGVDNTGKKVSVDYKGTLEDGTQFDSSYDRNEPLSFTVGSGQMIKGFDEAVKTMKPGETKTVTLSPDEAYGEYDESKVSTIKKSDIIQPSTYQVGSSVYYKGAGGATRQGTVKSIDGDNVTVDGNAQLAGKTLTFEITLNSVE